MEEGQAGYDAHHQMHPKCLATYGLEQAELVKASRLELQSLVSIFVHPGYVWTIYEVG
jgi:hypothetical protein